MVLKCKWCVGDEELDFLVVLIVIYVMVSDYFVGVCYFGVEGDVVCIGEVVVIVCVMDGSWIGVFLLDKDGEVGFYRLEESFVF